MDRLYGTRHIRIRSQIGVSFRESVEFAKAAGYSTTSTHCTRDLCVGSGGSSKEEDFFTKFSVGQYFLSLMYCNVLVNFKFSGHRIRPVIC